MCDFLFGDNVPPYSQSEYILVHYLSQFGLEFVRMLQLSLDPVDPALTALWPS